MALIKCPECGREVSDRAKSCPNCGFPLTEVIENMGQTGKEVREREMQGDSFDNKQGAEVQHSIQNQQDTVPQKSPEKENKKVSKIPIVILLIIVFSLLIADVVIYFNVFKPSNIYKEAKSLINSGEYDEAYEMLESIKGYKDVDEILEQKETYEKAVTMLESGEYEDAYALLETIQGYMDVDELLIQVRYESYAYACINVFKEILKNPDSIVLYDITFYSNMSEQDKEDTYVSAVIDFEAEYPACVMHYAAENGFGGNTTGYVLLAYDDEEENYAVIGTCDSLDGDDYDRSDDDDYYPYIICEIINAYRDYGETVGDIDMDRLKTILKNDAYSTIKIID